MLYTLEHITRYRYSHPVWLDPHTLRLRPRSDGSQTLRRFALRVDPGPMGMTESLDAENNCATRVWFAGELDRLLITTRLEVLTHRDNPFDFIVNDHSARLPLIYPPDEADRLASYRRREDIASPAGDDDPVADLAHEVAREAGYATLDFLIALTKRIHAFVRVESREAGDPMSPAQTLVTRCGACRDLTVLFMDACRVMGLAARFVSGYHEGDPGVEEKDLHAWPAVYLPLAGWRAYDPTLGLAVADRHVPVAASAHPSGAAPVTGTLRGGPVTTELSHTIRMQIAPTPPGGDTWEQIQQQQQQQ